jgi:hypothetical protein
MLNAVLRCAVSQELYLNRQQRPDTLRPACSEETAFGVGFSSVDRGGQKTFDFSHDTRNFFLIREGNHEELITLVEADDPISE